MDASQNENFDLTDKATGDSLRSGFDYNSGYILGLAGGYTLSPNVALELEYAYRNANADLNNVDSRGDVTSNAFMANAIYTFNGVGPNGAFKPYLGAGLGAADLGRGTEQRFEVQRLVQFRLPGDHRRRLRPQPERLAERRGPLLRHRRPGSREQRPQGQVALQHLRRAS